MVKKQYMKEFYNNNIRPLTRADGGDMKFVSFENNNMVLEANSACAKCTNCEENLIKWIKAKFQEEFGESVEDIKIIRNISYYSR